jgi:hypothetical protein
LQDANLNDDKAPPFNTFARIEILPPKGDYLNTDFEKWRFQIDESIKPDFLTKEHEDLCLAALLNWAEEVYAFNIEEARNPIHPFRIVPPEKITEEHLLLLKQWASVWGSVRDSVGCSVRGSVWAYVGSLFRIKEWKYIDHSNPLFEIGKYPFQSVVDLWKLGLVPSYDEKVWRLHGGEKAQILWEGKL